MNWQIVFTKPAQKEFAKLDRQTQQQIVTYLERVQQADDPRQFGKALLGDKSGWWRYRVGKYRLIGEIQQAQLVVEIIRIGKRDNIYD